MANTERNKEYFIKEKVKDGANRNFERLYRKKMTRKCASMQETLYSFFKKYHLERKLDEYNFVLYWKDIVGESIYNNAKPISLKNNILYVKTKSSAWVQELMFQKEIILNRLNSRVNTINKIKDIKFVV